jgi:hypothetical protein
VESVVVGGENDFGNKEAEMARFEREQIRVENN